MKSSIEVLNNHQIQLNFITHKFTIQFLDNNIDTSEWVQRLIVLYLKWKAYDILYPMNWEDIFRLVFKKEKILPPLNESNLNEISWEIKDSQLSPWESTIILNLVGLVNKVSIVNSKIEIIWNRMYYNFLKSFHLRIKVLIIDNAHFWQINENEFISESEREKIKFIINLYNINFESYWLYYFLVQTKLLYSLKEIHIKNKNKKFSLDLFKLIKKYWYKNKILSNIKLLSSWSNSNPLSEIVDSYSWNILKSSPDLNSSKLNQLVVKVIVCFYNCCKDFFNISIIL